MRRSTECFARWFTVLGCLCLLSAMGCATAGRPGQPGRLATDGKPSQPVRLAINTPTTFEELRDAGDQFFAAGDPYWALAHYRRAIKTHGHEPGLHFRIAKAAVGARQRAAGLAAIQRLEELRPATAQDPEVQALKATLNALSDRDRDLEASLASADDLILDLKYAANDASRQTLVRQIKATLYPHYVYPGQSDLELWRCFGYVAIGEGNTNFASHALEAIERLHHEARENVHFSNLIIELIRLSDQGLISIIRERKREARFYSFVASFKIYEGLEVPADNYALFKSLQDDWREAKSKQVEWRGLSISSDSGVILEIAASLDYAEELVKTHALGLLGQEIDDRAAERLLAEAEALLREHYLAWHEYGTELAAGQYQVARSPEEWAAEIEFNIGMFHCGYYPAEMMANPIMVYKEPSSAIDVAIERDLRSGVRWLQRAIAREAFDQEEQAECYRLLEQAYRGLGESRSAFNALRQSFEMGNMLAAEGLGVLYWNGDGTPENEARAVQVWRAGARAGDEYCKRQLENFGYNW